MTTSEQSEARTIERLAVDSSAVASAGYDAARQVLAIEFRSGLVIHYDGVPADLFELFGASESRGRFYSQRIKGKFSGRTMTGLCQRCAKPGYIGEQCEHCKNGTVLAIDRVHKR